MNEDRNDPLIDSLLEEALGGQAPPDLGARIMQMWATRGGVPTDGQAAGAPLATPVATPIAPLVKDVASMLPPAAVSVPAQPPLPEPPLQAPPVQGPPMQRSRSAGPPVQRRKQAESPRVSARSRWITFGVAATLLVAATVLGVVLTRAYLERQGEGTIADGPADLTGDSSGSDPSPQDGTVGPTEYVRPRTGFASQVAAAPHAVVVATLNNSIRSKWAEAGVSPAPPTTDGEWVRRTHLRMLGRIPSVDEVEGFEGREEEGSQKKAELLDGLLAADEFSEEYARTWTNYWTNVLIGRTGGTQDGSPVSREGLQQYLRESLLASKPFDQMAVELISATGANDPAAGDFNGATNFVLSGMEGAGELAAAKTCRIFMGQKMRCAQCHDHPLNKQVKQQDFWQLAAFFGQSGVERDDLVVRLVDRNIGGPGAAPQEAGVEYRAADGTQQVAFPVFLDGTELPRSGSQDELPHRTELARKVVGSQDFARAIVNRTWAHIMGRGFTWPIDDMGPHNPASHPELLDYMAEQFAAHDYDFRSLVRWIALSDVYSLSSQITDGNRADAPEITQEPLFTRYYARPMQPEEVYESLLALAGPQAAPEDFAAQEAAKLQWLGQFTIDLQTDDGSELSIFDTSYTQKLEMLTGDLVQQATDPENENGVLHRVMQSSMSEEEKVEHLFLASLARRPAPEEAAAAMQVIKDRPDDSDGALEDLWWALLNSSEFLLDQ